MLDQNNVDTWLDILNSTYFDNDKAIATTTNTTTIHNIKTAGTNSVTGFSGFLDLQDVMIFSQ